MVMAGTPIMLTSSTGSLTLTIDEEGLGGWCQVHLLVSGVSRPLGAETLRYIASSLVSFLGEPRLKPGLRSVLGLSELHTSAYGEHLAEEVILHLQDADGTMFAKLVLAPAERSQWLQELSPYTSA